MTTTAATATLKSLLTVPQPLAKLFSYFPLITYPPSKPERDPIVAPLLWIQPTHSVPGKESVLSADIECLKWQAHIALRGLRDVSVRWDISQEGALGGRLPNLRVPSEEANDPDGKLLAAQSIPAWIDEKVGPLDDLEGYKDVESRDESHAWIALLEGDIHAALVRPPEDSSRFCLSQLLDRHWPNHYRHSFITQSSSCLRQPPRGLSSPSSTHRQLRSLAYRPSCRLTAHVYPRTPSLLDTATQLLRSLSASGSTNGSSTHRTSYMALCLVILTWMSSGPTALDAAAFAYLHVLLHAEDDLRIEVARRVNLVHWELRVHEGIRSAFVPYKNPQ